MELTNVVVSADPFHCRVEPFEKPEPLMVMVKAGPPTVALGGLRDVMVVTAELIVNVAAFEIAPFAFRTVTLVTPAKASRLEGTVVVS